jgi:hypothetical protein
LKSDSQALLWGSLIAIVLVAVEWLLATRIPTLRMPVSDGAMKFSLMTVLLVAILVSGYQSLFRRVGYWLLLLLWLIAHVGTYLVFFSDRFVGLGHLQGDVLCGAIGGAEFVGFALVIVKIYGVGPKIKWL